jgi:small subunit ribosomal protein S6e
MKLNLANPTTGAQKLVEVDDEKRLRAFYDKRLAQEVDGEHIGDEYKGYIFKIMGGQDKQGFAMKQGVITPSRVRLLMSKGETGCRGFAMRSGERKRKSVRGCIVSHQISVLNLTVVKNGDAPIEGLTDKTIPRRLGPKRANKLRALFALSKEDDVRKYVIRREVVSKKEGGKPRSKAAKIQRLITPVTIQRKRRRHAAKVASITASKAAAAEYERMLAQRNKEKQESRRATLSKRQSARE